MMSTEALWEAMAHDIRRWLSRHTRDDALADDLLQETFLKAHAALPQLREEERIAPWMFRIARNVLIDHHRRTRDTEPLSEDPPTPQEEDRRAEQQIASWLPAMIDTLPEEYRMALRLSELEGLSQVEVARRLALSPSGARTRIQRGRKKLRAQLLTCCEIKREGGAVLDWRSRSEGCSC